MSYEIIKQEKMEKAILVSLRIGQQSREEVQEHLDELEITDKRHRRIATEGALLGTLKACDSPQDLVIISDDAGQFNVLAHALCWIHADRVFQRIVPLNDKHAEEFE